MFVIRFELVSGKTQALSGPRNQFATWAEAEVRLAELREKFPFSARRFSIGAA